MTTALRTAEVLLSLVAPAPQRKFAGLMLDGVDVKAALAAETDVSVLEQAFVIAQSGSEKIWATRFARRICELDRQPAARLRLASILAATGQCAEAQSLITDFPAKVDDLQYRRVLGVLHAKAGRTDEAFAVFETLPGRQRGYHPAPIVLSTAWDMMEQCDLAHVSALIKKLAEHYPQHVLVRSLDLRCQLFAGNSEKARRLAQLPESALEQAPPFERHAFIEAVADMLALNGWTEELFDFARDRIAIEPTHWSLYDHAAIAARTTAREKDYAALIDEIPSHARESAEVVAILCRWCADENRTEEVRLFLDKLRSLSATLFLEARLYSSFYGGDLTQIDAALAACEACAIPLLGPTVAYAIHAYYYNCSLDRLADCLVRLESFRGSGSKHGYFWQIYLRCLVALGQEERAEQAYRALPMGLARGALLGPFEMFFDARHGCHDAARKGWTKYIRATHHLCINAQSSYPRTVKLKYTEAPGAILLFATLVNAMDYLDWFLAHYRALGVDHFFMIDNGSDDGTLERLCNEDDISVFSNGESFARSGFGVLWVNHLLQRFGVGHWCFHVDSDEAFVFPGCDTGRTLRELLAFCDQRQFCSVLATELDMHPQHFDTTPGANSFELNCYFGTDYIVVPSELPPYVVIQGGIRQRLTGLALSMQKSPLVRLATDVRYIECNHRTTHLPTADVSGVLLHYKFVGNSHARIEQTISRGEHFGRGGSYRRLENAIRSMGSAQSLLDPSSQRYTGSASLVRCGLMKSSPAWEESACKNDGSTAIA
jgi:hypothetical protein